MLLHEVEGARDQPRQAYALDHLGVAQQATGDFAASLASRQRALVLARDSGDRLAEAVALNPLSEIHLNIGEYSAALPDAQRVEETLRQHGL